MSAPLVWIIIPFLVSVLLWFLQTKTRLVFFVSLVFCALMGLIALLQPIGGIVKIGPTSV